MVCGMDNLFLPFWTLVEVRGEKCLMHQQNNHWVKVHKSPVGM